MLSRKEQKEMMEQFSDLFSKLNRHKFHYALEKLGLREEIETVVKELSEEDLSVKGYELGDGKSEIYIPFEDGRIILEVYTSPPIHIVSFFPTSYEVHYSIRYTNLDSARKASKILRKRFKPTHRAEPIIIPTPFNVSL